MSSPASDSGTSADEVVGRRRTSASGGRIASEASDSGSDPAAQRATDSDDSERCSALSRKRSRRARPVSQPKMSRQSQSFFKAGYRATRAEELEPYGSESSLDAFINDDEEEEEEGESSSDSGDDDELSGSDRNADYSGSTIVGEPDTEEAAGPARQEVGDSDIAGRGDDGNRNDEAEEIVSPCKKPKSANRIHSDESEQELSDENNEVDDDVIEVEPPKRRKRKKRRRVRLLPDSQETASSPGSQEATGDQNTSGSEDGSSQSELSGFIVDDSQSLSGDDLDILS